MAAKILGIYSTIRLHSDWVAAEPDQTLRKDVDITIFVDKMQTYYHPTVNPTLKKKQFRSLIQGKTEFFKPFVIEWKRR